MRSHIPARTLAFVAAVLLAISATAFAEAPSSAEPTAPAAPEPTVAASEPEPESLGLLRSWRVAGSVLRERNSADGFDVSGSGGCIYNTTGSAFGVFNTPVDLPNGTVIEIVRMYYHDTSASNSTGWFTIYDLYGNIVDEFSVLSAGSTGYSFSDTAAINHVIDHTLYSYVLNWRPVVAGATMQLCGFRIFYS